MNVLIPVNQIFSHWKTLAGATAGQTLQVIVERLAQRGKAGRDQGKDNTLFNPVTTVAFDALDAGEVQLAIGLSEAAFKMAKDYEKQTGGEIHKGAITFDLGLLYLLIDDFTAAMRYFEISEAETRATETAADPSGTPSTFDLYRFDLFAKNFWDRIERQLVEFPVPIYKELWGVDYSKTTAVADWEKLSSNSKLLYIIATAQRLRYRQLAKETGWDGADSLRLAHWNLAADLARLLETELKAILTARGGTVPGELFGVLGQFTVTTKPSGLGPKINQLHSQAPYNYLVKNTGSFNAKFPDIRKAIEDPARAATFSTPNEWWDDRVCHAAYLLYATRNQVAHKVDAGMDLYNDHTVATFTVDVLISLCRLDGWTN